MTTKMTELRMRMRRERLGTRILTRVLSFTPRLDARYSTPGNFNGLEASGLTTPAEGERYFFFRLDPTYLDSRTTSLLL